MFDPERDVVGGVVVDYAVLGKEVDSTGRWIGADIELVVHPVGRFLLNIVTKARFLDEALETHFEDVSDPHRAYEHVEEKPPFVLNDKEITDEVLERKFRDRVVEKDLATSLWLANGEQAG